MSSTLSNLQAEVMTLSESPPDPGFVLPIPSRSRSRQNYTMPTIDFPQPVVCDALPTPLVHVTLTWDVHL